MPTHTIIRPFAGALLAAGALAVAACGGDDPARAADPEREARDAALKFAQCMRENGVDMPDPDSIGRQTFRVGPGEDITPEQLEDAQEACREYMDDVRPRELSEEQQREFKEAALAHARCMREHGIENFPDPTFGENGQARIQLDQGRGIDPDDPDFEEAEEACADELPDGPSETEVEEP